MIYFLTDKELALSFYDYFLMRNFIFNITIF